MCQLSSYLTLESVTSDQYLRQQRQLTLSWCDAFNSNHTGPLVLILIGLTVTLVATVYLPFPFQGFALNLKVSLQVRAAWTGHQDVMPAKQNILEILT